MCRRRRKKKKKKKEEEEEEEEEEEDSCSHSVSNDTVEKGDGANSVEAHEDPVYLSIYLYIRGCLFVWLGWNNSDVKVTLAET